MNELVNSGQIIQIRDKFRMPYSDNKNTISSCQMSRSASPERAPAPQPKKVKQTKLGFDESSSKSSATSSSNPNILPSINSPVSSDRHKSPNNSVKKNESYSSDNYVSCKVKYNNKNQTLMIMKRASTNHRHRKYLKRI